MGGISAHAKESHTMSKTEGKDAMNTHPIFDGIMKTIAGAACEAQQPPFSNHYVEELRDALRTIRNICDAPHWESKRRWKIRDIAEKALQ